jgi:hypothetical protein
MAQGDETKTIQMGHCEEGTARTCTGSSAKVSAAALSRSETQLAHEGKSDSRES